MHSGVYYRAELPLIALAYRDDHYAAVTIPVGKIIRVAGPAADDRFVAIEMDGEQFQVFETDLMDRCSAHAEHGPAEASPSANASS